MFDVLARAANMVWDCIGPVGKLPNCSKAQDGMRKMAKDICKTIGRGSYRLDDGKGLVLQISRDRVEKTITIRVDDTGCKLAYLHFSKVEGGHICRDRYYQAGAWEKAWGALVMAHGLVVLGKEMQKNS